MDNLMEKLAQRWNAQEIIKANSAAETQEVEKLRKEVQDYRECLSQLQGICDALKGTASSLEQEKQALSEELPQKLQSVVSGLGEAWEGQIHTFSEEALTHLEEAEARLSESLIKLQELDDKHVTQMELQEAVSAQTAHLEDVVHKENVKVYRNVQAVVAEETAQKAEGLKEAVDRLGGKLSAILGVSIAALVLAVAGLIFQILCYFQVF